MSRRDTILFAVLINTGLLVVLFATAMNTEEQPLGEPTLAAPVEEAKERVLALEEESRDVDQLLQQLSTRSVATSQKETRRPPQPVETTQRIAPPQQVVEPKAIKKEEVQTQPFVDVVVKRGDYLEKIAKANDVSVEEIMSFNDLPHSRLQVGQVLRIPLHPEKKTNQQEVVSVDEEEYYTIRRGDNPWLIALRHRMKLDDLLRLNNLDEEKARKLKPGDKLRVQ